MSFNTAIAVFLLIPFAVYALFAGLVFFNNIRAGKRLVASAKPFAREGDFPVKVLVVGDSLAVGVGAYDLFTLPERFASMLNASIENRAASGAKMKDIEQQILSASSMKYDYILIVGGANDIIRMTPDGVLQDAIRASYGAAKIRSERVVAITSGDVGIAPFFIFPFNLWYTKKTNETRPFFIDIAQELGVEYINLLIYEDVFHTDVPRYYAEDLLHLSSDGYGVWFEHIKERMQKVWNVIDQTPQQPKQNQVPAQGEVLQQTQKAS
ncbi:MAG: hypothetical protein RI911_338 [Candidatus Parcubacteria bacterium]|jgi:lysophospholipase L1-like esterase